ncbi:carbonic anhydrase [Halovenus sp. WSH3]|uniref:carbonic anhydrase n=2 Tax=Halovenus carboxidivorans TaxID=2692199 RepID=A0A6B0T0M0_9EURY|nr:carbonic anhydrase [Halovenus carboxidivorans]MXR51738.1 carbonic anhydrase [Halovenus carboxidivorans]
MPAAFFEGVETSQEPAAVSVCCSDSRVSQEAMWDVQEPGWLFTPSTIGNQVWDRHGGEQVVDGSVLYPVTYAGTDVMLVVGHTGCGAISAALDVVRSGPSGGTPSGVTKWVDLLAPVIESGLDDDRIDVDRDVGLVDQLVEYNVDWQIRFLEESEDVPDDISVFGFVYDFQGVYGDVPGRAYLVNVDGETDTTALEGLVPEEYRSHVRRLL